MDFPHMNDDKFPHLNTVDVYKFQNDFDYARWQGKVSIKLLNVLWNSNYADVPGFENDVKRDEWFDSQEGLIHTLESAFNITPENSVRIPVPYNDAYRFNYLMVDMPMQTSATQPIDYELENTRVKRWYYFIDSMEQLSPNTTELYVTLDVWTTFSHTVDIPYLMLERGHAPMFQTSASEYLSNPIENNEYLLADDFNYGTDARIVSNSSYIPIGNGRKWVLFALPMTQANLLNVGGADYSGNSTPPSYANTDERWGYQIVVNDYQWKYGHGDYSNATLPISAFLNEDSVFNGNYVFAVASDNASAFFNVLQNNCVHLLHAIQGVFVVAEDMISLGTAFNFKGYQIRSVNKQYSTYDLTLNKSAFGFDDKYSELAKLYTYPYSILEITDDNGFSREVRIENTGNMQFHKEISIAFPFVRYQTFFSGFNGDGKINYVWRNLSNVDIEKTMWEDDFSKFMMNWDIPTFAIYASAENEYAASNFAGMQARRQGAIIAYENATRFANTNYENVDDQTDVMVANTATQTGANTTITAQNVTTSKANTLRNNTASYAIKDANNLKINNDVVKQVEYAATCYNIASQVATNVTDVNNAASMATAGVSAIGGILGSAASGDITQFGQGVASGVSGIVNSGINAAAASASVSIAVGGNLQNTYESGVYAGWKATYAMDNNTEVTDQACRANTDTTNNTCTAMTNNTATQNAADITKTNATASMMDSNADWTRDANIAANKSNLEQVQREAAAQYANNRLGTPILETAYSGDAFPDVFERRGVRMNIRTQSKAAIAQVGDAFLRYGYALHRNWDMSNGWHYGKHFTFWKAEDLWINEGSGLAGNAVNIIGEILLKGVTVWRNPNEIGKVSIYENV